SNLSQITEDEVITDLRLLPEGVTAQRQYEQADAAFDEATRKLGPLANRRNSIRAEFEVADQECQELNKVAPLPVLAESDTVDGHQVRAARARQECTERTDLATAFHAEAEDIARRLTDTEHEAEKLEKDHQRLTPIRLSNERQLERLVAARTVNAELTIPSMTVKDIAALVSKLDEIERSFYQIRNQHDTLDTRREA